MKGRVLAGYRDGVAVYVPVDIEPTEEICKQCEGTGRLDFMAAYDGFERAESCQCENCDGWGVVHGGPTDDEG